MEATQPDLGLDNLVAEFATPLVEQTLANAGHGRFSKDCHAIPPQLVYVSENTPRELAALVRAKVEARLQTLIARFSKIRKIVLNPQAMNLNRGDVLIPQASPLTTLHVTGLATKKGQGNAIQQVIYRQTVLVPKLVNGEINWEIVEEEDGPWTTEDGFSTATLPTLGAKIARPFKQNTPVMCTKGLVLHCIR